MKMKLSLELDWLCHFASTVAGDLFSCVEYTLTNSLDKEREERVELYFCDKLRGKAYMVPVSAELLMSRPTHPFEVENILRSDILAGVRQLREMPDPPRPQSET